MQEKKQNVTIIYITNFNLYNQEDIELICNYKFFIQKTIIELGQDWRIESGLLAQDLLDSKEQQHSQFNIFNQFLSVFLKGKIKAELPTNQLSQASLQEIFMNDIIASFSSINPKVTSSLTFKTLSLGFWVTSYDIWINTFKNVKQQHFFSKFKPLAKLTLKYQPKTNLSYQQKQIESIEVLNNIQTQQYKQQIKYNKSRCWQSLKSLDNILTPKQLKKIKHSISKLSDSLKKAIVLSVFVLHNHQFTLHNEGQNPKKVRVLTISNYFYMCAFITWLIFNIKTYFSLTYNSYMNFLKYTLQNQWNQKFDQPLRKFFSLVQKQWSKLLKDYSVTLNDDTKVLKIFIERIKKQLESFWNNRMENIHSYLNI